MDPHLSKTRFRQLDAQVRRRTVSAGQQEGLAVGLDLTHGVGLPAMDGNQPGILPGSMELGAKIVERGDAGDGFHRHALQQSVELGGAAVKARVPGQQHGAVAVKGPHRRRDLLRLDQGQLPPRMVRKSVQHPSGADQLATGLDPPGRAQSQCLRVSHADADEITGGHTTPPVNFFSSSSSSRPVS